MSRSFFLFIASLFSAILYLAACSEQKPAMSGQITSTGEAQIGGDFSLIDHNGNPVTNADFIGKPQLIYFGYAYCPDICPMDLQKMRASLDLAQMGADEITPIFITVDPKRDSVEILAKYVKSNNFPKGLVGLSGSEEQITKAKNVFKVYAAKAGDGNDYLVNHSNLIYFMNENGKFLDVFGTSSTPAQIAERLKQYKKTGQ